MRIRRTAVLRLNAEHTKNISVLSHAPDIRFFAMQTNETIWIHKRLVLTQILSSPLCRRRRMTRMPPTRSRGLTCGKGSGKLRGFLSLPYICLLRALAKLKAKKDRAHLVLGPAMLAQYLIVKITEYRIHVSMVGMTRILRKNGLLIAQSLDWILKRSWTSDFNNWFSDFNNWICYFFFLLIERHNWGRIHFGSDYTHVFHSTTCPEEGLWQAKTSDTT